jgi:peptidoglycan hydrolase CwlO-like protein
MKVKTVSIKSLVLAIFFAAVTHTLSGQPGITEDMAQSTVKDQFNMVEERTRIYDNFRAVREDVFQLLQKNVLDTIGTMQKKISGLNSQAAELNRTISSLNENLGKTQTGLDEMTKSKNSMNLLGIQLEKGMYNTIMWSVIIILLTLLVIGFLVFKRNQNVVVQKAKDLQELKDEFEAYRKTSREAREKMALQHFNELKKLRGE